MRIVVTVRNHNPILVERWTNGFFNTKEVVRDRNHSSFILIDCITFHEMMPERGQLRNHVAADLFYLMSSLPSASSQSADQGALARAVDTFDGDQFAWFVVADHGRE